MTKKVLFTIALLSIFVWSGISCRLFVNIAKANPISEGKSESPPIITIQSPFNSTSFSLNNVLLAFTLTKPEGHGWIDDESIWANWTELRNKVVSAEILLDGKIYSSVDVNSYLSTPLLYSLNLTDLEDGKHRVRIITLCKGVLLEVHGLWERSTFYGSSSDGVYFTVDTTPPEIVVVPLENRTYGASDLQLNFTVSEAFSNASYVLDGQKNVAISGNTTLTDIPYGEHNITVYVTDYFGNIGISETLFFTIAEPFPTVSMATDSIASVAIICAGLLVCFKKRKR